MSAPAQQARFLLLALAIGCLLGVFYAFLQPFRRKHPHLSDLLLAIATFWGWLEHSFRICQGDLRLSYTLCLFLGIWLFHRTAGRWLQPVFLFFGNFLITCCFRFIGFAKKSGIL